MRTAPFLSSRTAPCAGYPTQQAAQRASPPRRRVRRSSRQRDRREHSIRVVVRFDRQQPAGVGSVGVLDPRVAVGHEVGPAAGQPDSATPSLSAQIPMISTRRGPSRAQKRSGSSSGLAVTTRPSARTTSAESQVVDAEPGHADQRSVAAAERQPGEPDRTRPAAGDQSLPALTRPGRSRSPPPRPPSWRDGCSSPGTH